MLAVPVPAVLMNFCTRVIPAGPPDLKLHLADGVKILLGQIPVEPIPEPGRESAALIVSRFESQGSPKRNIVRRELGPKLVKTRLPISRVKIKEIAALIKKAPIKIIKHKRAAVTCSVINICLPKELKNVRGVKALLLVSEIDRGHGIEDPVNGKIIGVISGRPPGLSHTGNRVDGIILGGLLAGVIDVVGLHLRAVGQPGPQGDDGLITHVGEAATGVVVGVAGLGLHPKPAPGKQGVNTPHAPQVIDLAAPGGLGDRDGVILHRETDPAPEAGDNLLRGVPRMSSKVQLNCEALAHSTPIGIYLSAQRRFLW